MDAKEPRAGADLVLHNARVMTFDPERPTAEWVAVRGNRILAAGKGREFEGMKRPGTRLVDCEGGSVIPGFNDAHCHPLALAVSLLSVDCSPESTGSIGEIKARIRERAAQVAEGEWIRAANYDETRIDEKRPPTRWELDAASPGHPVILTHHTTGHCVLNSLAMQRAGITRDTPDPAGGSIHRSPENGEPDGRVSGRNELVEKALPPLGEDELERGMRLANREYLRCGITSIQDTGWSNGVRHWRTWQRLVERDVVSPRVSMMLGTDFLEASSGLDLSMGAGDSRLRVGGIKLALDESTGCPHPPQHDIERLALRASREGYCTAFHVGDVPMLESSLAAIRFVRRELPDAKLRFRLEHCTVCPPELLLKIRASRAIVVTQPSFLRYMGDGYHEAVLAHQGAWFQPLGSFLRWGVQVAFSSDAPLVPSDPLAGIHAAITRRTEAGTQLDPRECISVPQALEMYTMGGARASFEDDEKGSIRPGKLADLAVLDGDLARTPFGDIRALKILRCVIDGKVVGDDVS